MSTRSRTRRASGFTLIELLVVITIISILGGMVMAAISASQRTAKIRQTETLLTAIGAALTRYETDFNDFPPSDGDESGIAGSEALLECLKTEKKEGPYIGGTEIKSIDSNRNGKPELADAWGQPVRYLHHRDYGNRPPNKRTFRMLSSGPDKVSDDGGVASDDLVNWNKAKPE